jgi:predicted PurR-regulated permease PerM
VFFTLVALAVLLYLVYLVRSVLGLLFIATFLAIALGPAVDFFVRRHVPRALAIVAAFLSLGMVIFIIGLLVVPPVVDGVEQLAVDAPGYVEDLRKNETIRRYDDRYDVSEKLTDVAETLPSRLDEAAETLQAVTFGVVTTIVQFIAVLTICFFLLKDGARIQRSIFELMAPDRRRRFELVAADVYSSVGGYVAGALTIATICGFVTYLTLLILGVPFAVPLAVMSAFLALIPLVGATVAGVIVGLVTALNDFPQDTIAWVVVIMVYQQIESNVLQPFVYRRTVNLHPLVIITAILFGASLLGILGALVAIPIAAAVQILLRDFWAHHRVETEVLAPEGGVIKVGTSEAIGAARLERP